MEQMTQELDASQYDIKRIQKMYNQASNSNMFLNQYTLLDVEECKKKLFLSLMKRYNYTNQTYIQTFVDETASKLSNQLFSNNGEQRNTQMVGVKDVIHDPRKLNPKYFQETYRIINIDSTYRSNFWKTNYVYDSKTSTNMMVDLNDKLDNVVTLELTNLCIPYTFYNIDSENGNNFFYIVDANGVSNKIEISGGNYTNHTLIEAINANISAHSHEFKDHIVFSLDHTSHKVTIENTHASTHEYTIVFYNNELEDESNNNECSSPSKINNNLGWIIGFRNINQSSMEIVYTLDADTTTILSESVCFIPETKYFIIVIDDLNKNQTNKGLVQISNDKEFIKSTQYFKNLTPTTKTTKCITDDNFDTYTQNANGTPIQNQALTKNQLYSALQINNYATNLSEKSDILNTNLINNVFAIVPFENKSLQWGLSMFTSDKNKFKRKYTGPVNISKLNIKLLNDKGNVMNLNGSEWSLSMISTHLYER